MPGLINMVLTSEGIDPANATPAQMTATRTMMHDAYVAVTFILGADRKRYGRLIDDLENDYIQGQDNFPKSLNAA
jgi:hypothetical protein